MYIEMPGACVLWFHLHIACMQIHSKNVQTMWEDNPDRFLLEMGGVNTSREQKTD